MSIFNCTRTSTRLAAIALAATVIASLAAAPTQAHTPEEQLGFARQLLADGDQAFALLEHKRFLHHHRNHKEAPAVAIATAKLYIGYLNNFDRANNELSRTAAIHKKSAGGQQVKAFQTFLTTNSDFDRKPLTLYLAAQIASSAGDQPGAISKYDTLINTYPKSKLMDDALMGLGTVYLEKTNQPDKAGPLFLRVVNEYPNSELFPDANLMYVMTIEKQKGPSPEVAAAYQRLAARYPNTPAGKRAAERLKIVEKATVIYKRQYAKSDAASFAVRKSGYVRFRDQFAVHLEMSQTASDKQLRATLEEALVQHIEKRKDKKHSMQVEAYFNYPLSKAGTLTWSPDKQPQYVIKKRDTEDVLKDTLLDLFKKK